MYNLTLYNYKMNTSTSTRVVKDFSFDQVTNVQIWTSVHADKISFSPVLYTISHMENNSNKNILSTQILNNW